MSAVSQMALLGGGGLSLQNAVSPLTLTADRASWGTSPITIRQIIANTNIIKTGSGGVKVTFEAAAAMALAPLAVYIGEQSGSGQAFVSTPVQLLFGGSGTPTISAGASLTSDTAAFTITGSAGLIVAMTISQTTIREKTGATTGYQLWYKAGSDASTVAATGYTDFSGTAAVSSFKALQIFA